MATYRKYSLDPTLPMAGALILSAAALLGGCVVREVAPPPPPPRAYVQPTPPPPAADYVEPASDGEVTANEAPPPLPEYDQPPCPDDGYLWTPGYWAWGGGGGYYWVPGTWVQPPRVGVLWTPPYWGFVGGVYAFHAGYWGPHIGYYGGVNYGFGYVGAGFAGGRWVGNSFAYNRAVTNINVTVVHNTYHETVINNVSVNRVSYNGGPHGTAAVMTAQERAVGAERHIAATPMQREHFQESGRNPALMARANGGHPAIAATPRPAAFNAPGAVGAHGASTPPGAAAHAGEPGQIAQQNGGVHAPGQPGQGQPNNFVRTPGQPTGTARTQGQPQGQGQSQGQGQKGPGPTSGPRTAGARAAEQLRAHTGSADRHSPHSGPTSAAGTPGPAGTAEPTRCCDGAKAATTSAWTCQARREKGRARKIAAHRANWRISGRVGTRPLSFGSLQLRARPLAARPLAL